MKPRQVAANQRMPLRGARRAGWLLVACLASIVTGCNDGEKEEKRPEFEIEKEYKRGPVTFVVRISRKEITIADRLRLVLEVRAKEDYDVRLPEFGEKLELFGIVDYHATQPELGEGEQVILSKTYELEPFLSGDYKIPPMKVTFWKKAEGREKKHELESEELTVKVKSLLPEKSAELTIRDIAPPVELPRTTPAWLYWLLGALLVGACGVTAFIVRLRRRKRVEEAIRRPAHEVAYDEMEKLLARKLVEKGEVKEFYISMSDILRRYIENRFGLHAPERTTEEFLAEIGSNHVLAAAHNELLGEFLRHCDMVKFAEHQPSNREIQGAFDACKKFVVETEEKPDAGSGIAGPAAEVAGHAV